MNQPVVECVGNDVWPRFRIVDGDRYWAGNKWSQKARDARLFLNRNEADQVCGLLPSTRQFCTTVTVTVTTAEDYTLDDLRQFLEDYRSAVYRNSVCKTEVAVNVENLIEIT